MRGLELGKTLSFANSAEGFAQMNAWVEAIAENAEKNHAMIGIEPTGHYWFMLTVYLKDAGMKLVLVSPIHVKRTKELDDNDPSKSDRKGPKTIAKLVLEGRYLVPCVPEGVYAELRIYLNCRWRGVKELIARENQIQRRLKIYFPEYSEIFSSVSAAGSMALLHWTPLPRDLLVLGADGIDQIWRQQKLRVIEKNGHKGRLMRRKRASAARKVMKKTQEKLRLYMEERVLC